MTDGTPPWQARPATADNAGELAALLHDFNTEFATETPGPKVLAERLRHLLVGEHTFAVVAGAPLVGFGLVTLRPNVWFDGPVALLDELYVVPAQRGHGIGARLIELMESMCRDRGVELVEINVDEGDHDARRFYERLGFRCAAPDDDERALYYFRSLG